MSDALVIASATPIVVTIMARIFLDEKCGVITIVASFMTLGGVVIINKPPLLTGEQEFDETILIGSALATGCMVLAAISYTVLRYIRKVHYTVTTLMFGLWGVGENLVLAVLFHVFNTPETSEQWMLVGGLTVITFLGQIAIVCAMKAEQAGPVAIIRTFDVLFAFGWQVVFLHSVPDKLSIIGAAVVVFAVGLCGFRKWLRGLPIGHPTRSRFRYFMM